MASQNNNVLVTPNARQLAVYIQSGVPMLLWGNPGCGKSEYLKMIAKLLNRHIEIVFGSQMRPEDLGVQTPAGRSVELKHPDGKTYTLRLQEPLMPEWFYNLARTPGLFVAEELTTLTPGMQGAMLGILQDAVLNNIRMHPSTLRVAAANPPEVAAGGYDLAPPTANRFGHVQFDFPFDKWVTGINEGFEETNAVPVLPDGWKKEYLPRTKAMITSYLKTNPAATERLPKDDADKGYAWASRRSWTNAMTVCAAALASDKEADMVMAAGTCVGRPTASEFQAWVMTQDLMDPEDMLAKPDAVGFDNRLDRTFIMMTSMSAAVQSRNTANRWSAAWQIAEKAVEVRAKDVVIKTMGPLCAKEARPAGVKIPKVVGALIPLIDRIKEGRARHG